MSIKAELNNWENRSAIYSSTPAVGETETTFDITFSSVTDWFLVGLHLKRASVGTMSLLKLQGRITPFTDFASFQIDPPAGVYNQIVDLNNLIRDFAAGAHEGMSAIITHSATAAALITVTANYKVKV